MLFFFFKQKTAYEMRISDWSSDVCSSDLVAEDGRVVGLWLVDQQNRGVEQFGGVVRRDRGRHAHRDAGGAVRQQVGEGTGEQLGFLVLAIVGRAEIGGVLVEPVHQVDRDLRPPRLGVAIGGGEVGRAPGGEQVGPY